MKNKRGYTVVELIVLIAVVGVISFVAINKASYAFSDNAEAEKTLSLQIEKTIETQAIRYGEDHLELFEDSHTVYIRVLDLKENNYLLNSSTDIDENQKIELILKNDKVSAYLEK